MNFRLLAINNADQTITAAINGCRYEYWIEDGFAPLVGWVQNQMRRGADGRVLNRLKRVAVRCDKLSEE